MLTCPGGCGQTTPYRWMCFINRSLIEPGAEAVMFCGRSPCYERLGGPEASEAWERMTETEREAWRNEK